MTKTSRAAAVAVLAGVLLGGGLSACGTSSPKGPAGTAAPSVQKKAGAFSKDVQVTVTNAPSTNGSLIMSICAAGSTIAEPGCAAGVVADGKSIHLTSESVSGRVQDGAVNGFYWYAFNPDVGEPYFQLWKIGDLPSQASKTSLSEGEVVTSYLGGRKIELSRAGDTDVKVMNIKILL